MKTKHTPPIPSTKNIDFKIINIPNSETAITSVDISTKFEI